MTQYQTASDVDHLSKIFRQPIPIVAACNRAAARQERAKGREWWKGVAVALSAVIGALAIVWVVQ